MMSLQALVGLASWIRRKQRNRWKRAYIRSARWPGRASVFWEKHLPIQRTCLHQNRSVKYLDTITLEDHETAPCVEHDVGMNLYWVMKHWTRTTTTTKTHPINLCYEYVNLSVPKETSLISIHVLSADIINSKCITWVCLSISSCFCILHCDLVLQ